MSHPDRWQHARTSVSRRARTRRSERTPFLREACRGDEPLQRDVESLLTFEHDARAFMQASAFEIAACSSSSQRRRTACRPAPRALRNWSRSSAQAGWATSTVRAIRRSAATWRSRFCRMSSRRTPNRRARFEREARLLAALNHPHIGAIYGFEQRDGIHGLVLELVEGQTLAERLSRGPAAGPRGNRRLRGRSPRRWTRRTRRASFTAI